MADTTPTVFVSPYEELTPLKGALLVAMAEDGEILQTVHVITAATGIRKAATCREIVSACRKYYPDGYDIEWVAAEEREHNTNFQIALGLHNRNHSRSTKETSYGSRPSR